ncbi:MAG: HNH endonuclease [Spirulina sp. SIO3F2]|nr:HNH endonuclease [Spirulina sp. SIO3F2]
MLYFEKSQPAPACLEAEKLRKNGDYKCGDVILRLADDFKNKCYICEAKEPTDINVEHFRPHKDKDIDLKFDWNNLFFACSRCNRTKGTQEDLLDCTNKLEDPELRLKIVYQVSTKSVQIVVKEGSVKAQNTAELLQTIYNGTTPLQKLNAANLRKSIDAEIQNFTRLLQKYLLNRHLSEKANQLVLEKIADHLSKSSNFAGFKRWIIRDNEELYKVLKAYLD